LTWWGSLVRIQSRLPEHLRKASNAGYLALFIVFMAVFGVFNSGCYWGRAFSNL